MERIETLCARAGGDPPSVTRPLVAPIYQASVFAVESVAQLDDLYEGRAQGYIYSRDANPNHHALEQVMAALEGGEAALACATGMAAIATALVSELRAGDHLLASRALYGATPRLIREELGRLGIRSDFVDATDLDAVARAVRPETRVLFVETLSNPLLELADLEALGGLCRERGVRLIVDNTFTPPPLVRPLALGASLAIHSLTKFIGGHSDLMLGMIVGDAEAIARARQACIAWGGAANPFAAWLAVRGIKTLPLRMERACANAARLAAFLEGHPAVERVFYPGLPSHSQHARAAALLPNGSGAMLAFALAGGGAAAAVFLERLRLIPFCPSLGETGTTISYPSKTSHRFVAPEEAAAQGIHPGVLRLSVGIEHADDLLADLEQALRDTPLDS
jgi:cystathionine beta-lyase/cystathionine gamma-synthase